MVGVGYWIGRPLPFFLAPPHQLPHHTSFPTYTHPPHPPITLQPPPPGSFITVFVTVFATVIAITKDLPDVEGDQAHGIQTFATRMGVPAVANLGGLFVSAAGEALGW